MSSFQEVTQARLSNAQPNVFLIEDPEEEDTEEPVVIHNLGVEPQQDLHINAGIQTGEEFFNGEEVDQEHEEQLNRIRKRAERAGSFKLERDSQEVIEPPAEQEAKPPTKVKEQPTESAEEEQKYNTVEFE